MRKQYRNHHGVERQIIFKVIKSYFKLDISTLQINKHQTKNYFKKNLFLKAAQHRFEVGGSSHIYHESVTTKMTKDKKHERFEKDCKCLYKKLLELFQR